MSCVPMMCGGAIWIQIECLAVLSLGFRPVPLEIRQQERAKNMALSQIIVEGKRRCNLWPGSRRCLIGGNSPDLAEQNVRICDSRVPEGKAWILRHRLPEKRTPFLNRIDRSFV